MSGHKREGLVLEVLGKPGHEHYRVRWDDDGHESIFFPSSDARAVVRVKDLHTSPVQR